MIISKSRRLGGREPRIKISERKPSAPADIVLIRRGARSPAGCHLCHPPSHFIVIILIAPISILASPSDKIYEAAAAAPRSCSDRQLHALLISARCTSHGTASTKISSHSIPVPRPPSTRSSLPKAPYLRFAAGGLSSYSRTRLLRRYFSKLQVLPGREEKSGPS